MSVFNSFLIAVIFFIGGIVVAESVNYSIELHTIEITEPLPALYLADNAELVINCDQSKFNKLEHIHVAEIVTNNTMVKHAGGEFRTTFDSGSQNGNVILCLAINAETNQKMSGKVRLLTVLNKPFYGSWKMCGESNYCHNRGICYQDPENDSIKVCVCNYFVGKQCELIAGRPQHPILVQRKLPEGVSTLLFGVMLAFCGLFIIAFIISTVGFWYKHKTERKLRKNFICSKCNVEKCHSHHDDQTQTLGGAVKNQYQEVNQEDGL